MKYHEIQRISREKVESDVTFLGLLIMQNKLKPISSEIISQLQAANVRSIMATGDNGLTAIAVARDCKIVDPMHKVFLGELTEKGENERIRWTNIEMS
jgi:cation-transporting ATPase 13A2